MDSARKVRLERFASSTLITRRRAWEPVEQAIFQGLVVAILALGFTYRRVAAGRQMQTIVGRGLDPADCRCGHARRWCPLARFATPGQPMVVPKPHRRQLSGFLPMITSDSERLQRQAGERLLQYVLSVVRSELIAGRIRFTGACPCNETDLAALLRCLNLRTGRRGILALFSDPKRLTEARQKLKHRFLDELIVEQMMDDSVDVQDFGLRLMLCEYEPTLRKALRRIDPSLPLPRFREALKQATYEFYASVHRFDPALESVYQRLFELTREALQNPDLH